MDHEPTQEPASDDEVFAAYPRARIDRDNVEVYRARLARRLVAMRCADCGRLHAPPRSFCPDCLSAHVSPSELSGQGTLALRPVLHLGVPADGVDYGAGHRVGVVDLAEQPGLRVSAALLAAPGVEVPLGAPVELAWIERDGQPVPAFRPIEEAQA